MKTVAIEIGMNPDSGEFLSIYEVESGKTDLVCPFCSQPLLAKKGTKIMHHFAHMTNSCISEAGSVFGHHGNTLRSSLSNSAFYYFIEKRMIEVPPKQLLPALLGEMSEEQKSVCLSQAMDFLKRISEGRKANAVVMAQFEKYDGLSEADFSMDSPASALSDKLPKFWNLKSADIEDWVSVPYHTLRSGFPSWSTHMYPEMSKNYGVTLPEELLKAFIIKSCDKRDKAVMQAFEKSCADRARLQEIHDKFSLYLLRIKQSSMKYPFYKVGITSRPIETRIREIKTQLGSVESVEVLLCEPKMAFMERYFKMHYNSQRYVPFKEATEYFTLSDGVVEDILLEFEDIKGMVSDFRLWEAETAKEVVGKVLKHERREVYIAKYSPHDGHVYSVPLHRMLEDEPEYFLPLTAVRRIQEVPNAEMLKAFVHEANNFKKVVMPEIERILKDSPNAMNVEILKRFNELWKNIAQNV